MNNYILNENCLTKTDKSTNIIIKDSHELNDLDNHLIKDFIDSNITKINFFDDIFYGSVLLTRKTFGVNKTIFFILNQNKLTFYMEQSIEEKYVTALNQELRKHNIKFDKQLYLILLTINIILNNIASLIKIYETNIDTLENNLIINNEYSNFNKKLLSFRKDLTRQRKAITNIDAFLESLLFEINEDKPTEYIKLLKNKNDRAFQEIRSLSEHSIQLKEVYQNQLDISLNNTMNFFTVISTIFLPLTLITSWYGMNFKMPEFFLNHGYLIPITLSVLSIILIGYLIRKFNIIKKNNF